MRRSRKTSSKPETPLGQALDAAYRLLARGDRFRAEIARELVRKGHGAETDAVLARLEARGLLDEFRVARAHAEAKSGKRALGDARLRAELRQRGASNEAIDSALEEIVPETERASALLASRYRVGDDPARHARFLAGRGFDADAIHSALAHLADGE